MIHRLAQDVEIALQRADDKLTLIGLAVAGKNRPGNDTAIGRTLNKFLCTASGRSYSNVFTKIIRKVRPDWFRSSSEDVAGFKRQLLLLAKTGQPKPAPCTKLCRVLITYINAGSDSFDPVFSKHIRALRPEWFRRYHYVQKTAAKQELLALAQSGAQRPKQHTRLARALERYAFPGRPSFDKEFAKTIRKARPEWFKTPSAYDSQVS